MIQAKDEEDSAVAKRKKTPEVARESSGRSSLLLRAAVGAVEADGAEAAEKVFEGGFFSVRSPMAAAGGAASSRSPLQRITPSNTPCGGLAGGSSTSNSREDNGLIS